MKFELPLDKMTVEEKWEAFEIIWADLFSNPNPPPIPPSHQKILDARLKEAEENPGNLVSWESLVSRLKNQEGTKEP